MQQHGNKGGRSLNGWRILVVEDDPLIAEGLAAGLGDDGAEIVGPASTVAEALALVGGSAHIDTAILDVGLKGEEAFAVADALDARGIPFIFASGYDDTTIPDRYSSIRRCEKPFGLERVVEALTNTQLGLVCAPKSSARLLSSRLAGQSGRPLTDRAHLVGRGRRVLRSGQP
jgi:DNA-binding NarL/FixJ family response regulator